VSTESSWNTYGSPTREDRRGRPNCSFALIVTRSTAVSPAGRLRNREDLRILQVSRCKVGPARSALAVGPSDSSPSSSTSAAVATPSVNRDWSCKRPTVGGKTGGQGRGIGVSCGLRQDAVSKWRSAGCFHTAQFHRKQDAGSTGTGTNGMTGACPREEQKHRLNGPLDDPGEDGSRPPLDASTQIPRLPVAWSPHSNRGKSAICVSPGVQVSMNTWTRMVICGPNGEWASVADITEATITPPHCHTGKAGNGQYVSRPESRFRRGTH
jgi:hypothetical protein